MREYNDYLKDVTELIYKIRKKPAAFLGQYSITRLKSFLDGFSFGYNYPEYYSFYPEFQAFVDEKYNPKKLTADWATMFLRITNDERKGLDMFFEEFEIFLKEQNIEIP